MSRDRRSWLLLHGTPLSPAVWDGISEGLREVGPVQYPDITPAREAIDVQADLAAQVLAALPDDGDRVDLVGHSFGGQVALEIALTYPERVRSLTLLCSRDTPFPPFAAAATRIRRGDAPDTEAAIQRWFRPAELAAGAPLVEFARSCLRDCDLSAWARALDAIATYDRRDRVHELDLPVTLVAAEFDEVSTPAVMADLASRIPGARLLVLPGAAHLSPFLRPAELCSTILAAADMS